MAGEYWEGMGRSGGKNKGWDLDMIIFYQMYIRDSKKLYLRQKEVEFRLRTKC